MGECVNSMPRTIVCFITRAEISGGLTKLRGKWEKSRAELILVPAVRGRDEARNRRDIAMPRSLSSQSTSRKLTFLNTNWIWAEREESRDARARATHHQSVGSRPGLIIENVVSTSDHQWSIMFRCCGKKCEVWGNNYHNGQWPVLVVQVEGRGNALLTDHFLSHTFNVCPLRIK